MNIESHVVGQCRVRWARSPDITTGQGLQIGSLQWPGRGAILIVCHPERRGRAEAWQGSRCWAPSERNNATPRQTAATAAPKRSSERVSPLGQQHQAGQETGRQAAGAERRAPTKHGHFCVQPALNTYTARSRIRIHFSLNPNEQHLEQTRPERCYVTSTRWLSTSVCRSARPVRVPGRVGVVVLAFAMIPAASRKPHRKSRNGCGHCKRRKIKVSK